MNLHLTPVQIATGSNDTESQLVFHDGSLVAVLVRLSDEHEAEAGKWFLEAALTDLRGSGRSAGVDRGSARVAPLRRGSLTFDNPKP